MADVIECDAVQLQARAGSWLAAEPMLHNVVCTVIQRWVEATTTDPDAHWFLVEEASDPVGVAILTPPFPLGLTPMADEPLSALVDAVAEQIPALSGVSGPGDVPARFAERWRKRTGAEVEVGMAQLMYRLDEVVPPPLAGGKLRWAEDDDRQLLYAWFAAFCEEAGAVAGNIRAGVDRRLAAGGLYLWDDGAPLTMAGVAPAVAGVVRVGPVYTPPALRRRGYASNCVAALSRHALDNGAQACMLYTDAANPTSNAIYQRIGYRPVAEAGEFRFRYRVTGS
jgi:predicted GNAT family acetyltransferase